MFSKYICMVTGPNLIMIRLLLLVICYFRAILKFIYFRHEQESKLCSGHASQGKVNNLPLLSSLSRAVTHFTVRHTRDRYFCFIAPTLHVFSLSESGAVLKVCQLDKSGVTVGTWKSASRVELEAIPPFIQC